MYIVTNVEFLKFALNNYATLLHTFRCSCVLFIPLFHSRYSTRRLVLVRLVCVCTQYFRQFSFYDHTHTRRHTFYDAFGKMLARLMAGQ